MDQLPTAMMGFGLGLLTASLTTAVVGSLHSTAALAAQTVPGLTSPRPITEAAAAAVREAAVSQLQV